MSLKPRAESKQILENAINRYGLNSLDGFTPRNQLIKLIDYARSIGFNEGWDEAKVFLNPEDLEEI